jgi:hypothetical protein
MTGGTSSKVARIRKTRNPYKILIGSRKEEDYLRDLSYGNGRIILKHKKVKVNSSLCLTD